MYPGESTLQFLGCLSQHQADKMLRCAKNRFGDKNKDYLGKDRPARYWICAYANNQWRLHEEIAQERLEETSFYRAIKLSRGTVSVLDPKVRALSNSRHELMRVGVSAGRLL